MRFLDSALGSAPPGGPSRRGSLLTFAASMQAEVTFAARNLLRRPRRTAVSISAVAGGIVALLLASGFIEWIFHDMREQTIHAQLGHIQVTRPGWHEHGRADPLAFLLPDNGAEIDGVAALPGVTAVAPRFHFSRLVSHEETTVSFVGEGVDARKEAAFAGGFAIVTGSHLADGDAHGALLGVGLASNLGVKVGDTIAAIVNRRSGGINAVELTVRGTFSTISKAYDDTALRMPLATAETLAGIHGAQAWVVLLHDTDATGATVAELRRRLPPQGFEVTPWYALADFYNKTVALFSRQIDVVRAVIAAIIVLSITNTMTMTVVERTGEIGTAMALGTRRRRVMTQFLVEGALLGALGGLVGILLGIAIAGVVSAIGIPMPAPPGMAHGYVAAIVVTPAMTVAALALAVATTLAASAWPAWKASRLVIVDALRHQR
jgi:putative ABC transport system permease protein